MCPRATDANGMAELRTRTLSRKKGGATYGRRFFKWRLQPFHTRLPNEMFNKTMDSVNSYEENVRMSRMVYNDSATKMNRAVRQWPSSFVASMLHFTEREYLKVDQEQKSQMPDLFGEK